MDNSGLCTDCFEAITNPVCLSCFLKQINQWFITSRIDSKTRQKIIGEIRAGFYDYSCSDENLYCTLCRKEEVSICSYCFFLRVNKILKKFSIKKNKMDNFMEVFNYRHGNDDY